MLVTRKQVDGFDALTLSNDHLVVTVLPGLGGKIISLVNRRTGRDWVWRSGKLPQYFPMPMGTSFDDGPVAGFDECLPTIAPCTWQDRQLPDHSEVWTMPWEVDEVELDRHRLVTRIRLSCCPLLFERAMTLHDKILTLSYHLQNTSDQAVDYLWAFHPMLNIIPGDHMILPASVTQVKPEICMGDWGELADASLWPWPSPAEGIDLSCMQLGEPDRAVKLFAVSKDYDTTIHTGMCNKQTGDSIMFHAETGLINAIGVWINRGAYHDYQHAAIELSNAASDSLQKAAVDRTGGHQLGKQASDSWSFDMILGTEF